MPEGPAWLLWGEEGVEYRLAPRMEPAPLKFKSLGKNVCGCVGS